MTNKTMDEHDEGCPQHETTHVCNGVLYKRDINVISRADMNEIFQNHLGQSYDESTTDDRGCYMDRRGYRLSPSVICQIIDDVLQFTDKEIEAPELKENQNEH